MNSRLVAFVVGIVATLGTFGTSAPAHANVFVNTNAVEGNEVLVYQRNNRGELTFVGSAATDGFGTGTSLDSQDSVVFTGKLLLVANAGSNDISVFRVRRTELTLTDVEPSGGEMPISIALARNTVYVLNAGGEPNITAFRLTSQGDLTPIEDGTISLAGLVSDPVGLQLNRNGRLLVVVDRGANTILTFPIDRRTALPGEPTIEASAGTGPSGFRFNRRGRLIVAESAAGLDGAGSVSVFSVNTNGVLTPISVTVPTEQTGTSAVLVTRNDRFIYVANSGSGTISGFTLDRRTGELVPFTDGGVAADVGFGADPVELAVTNNSRFIYVLNAGTGEIIGYQVNTRTGELTPITVVDGIPTSASGLVTR